MDAAEVFGESESVSLSTGVCNDFERSKVFVGELSGRTCGADMIGFDEDGVTNLQLRRTSTFSISGALIAELCRLDLIAESGV